MALDASVRLVDNSAKQLSSSMTQTIHDLPAPTRPATLRRRGAVPPFSSRVPTISPSAVSAPASPYNFRLLAVSAAGFCVFLSVYATQSILPLLAQVFRASEMKASLTVTATTLAIALAAPAVGLLAERAGRKRVIVAAIFLLALPTFLASTVHSLEALIGWRFAQGLLMPGIIAVTMAYVAEEWPAEQVGSAMSAYISGNVLAGVTGRLMTGCVAARLGWSRAFVILAALDLLGGILVWKGLPPSRLIVCKRSTFDSARDMARHFKNGQLLAAYGVGFLVLLVMVATFTYVTYPLAARPFNLGPAALGSLFLVYLLGVVVTPIGGILGDRHGQKVALLLALIAVGVGLALTLVPSLPMVIAGLALCSTGIFVCQSATASYMGLVAGTARASASGLYATFYYLGGAAGAFLPGLFWTFGGWHATVAFLLAILFLIAFLVLTTWKRRAM